MVSHIREDLRLSGRCGPLSGPIDPGGKCPGTSKVVRSVIGGVTRGPARMMPYGQVCKGTHGKTRGRKPPQCPFQHVHLCPCKGGWAEIVHWSPPMWVRHMSIVKKGVTSTNAFCQAACRFGVCFLTAVF